MKKELTCELFNEKVGFRYIEFTFLTILKLIFVSKIFCINLLAIVYKILKSLFPQIIMYVIKHFFSLCCFKCNRLFEINCSETEANL